LKFHLIIFYQIIFFSFLVLLQFISFSSSTIILITNEQIISVVNEFNYFNERYVYVYNKFYLSAVSLLMLIDKGHLDACGTLHLLVVIMMKKKEDYRFPLLILYLIDSTMSTRWWRYPGYVSIWNAMCVFTNIIIILRCLLLLSFMHFLLTIWPNK
jgi:hypothetical protein